MKGALRHSTARSAVVALVGRVAGRLLHFAGQIITARLLGPAGFGLYAIVWVVMRIATVPSVLGLDLGVLHFGAKKNGSNGGADHVLSTSSLLALIWASAIGVLVALAAPTLSRVIGGDGSTVTGLRIAAVSLPALSVLRVLSAGLRLDGSTAASVLIEDVLRPLLYLISLAVGLIFALRSANGMLVWTAASFWLAAAVAAAMIGLKRGTRALIPSPLPQRYQLREILAYAIPVSATSLTAVLALQLDQFLVATVLNTTQVGLYAAAVQTAAVFPVVLSALDLPLGPRVANAHARGDLESAGAVYRSLARWGILLLAPVTAVLLAAPKLVLSVLFGPEYQSASEVVIILALGFVVNGAAGGIALVLFMIGQQRVWLRLSLLGIPVNAALTLIGAKYFGLAGAAFAPAFTMAAQNVLGVVALKHSAGIRLTEHLFWVSLIVTGATTVIAVLTRSLTTQIPETAALGLVVAVATTVSMTLAYLVALSPNEKQAIRRNLPRVR